MAKTVDFTKLPRNSSSKTCDILGVRMRPNMITLFHCGVTTPPSLSEALNDLLSQRVSLSKCAHDVDDDDRHGLWEMGNGLAQPTADGRATITWLVGYFKKTRKGECRVLQSRIHRPLITRRSTKEETSFLLLTAPPVGRDGRSRDTVLA